MSADRTRPAPYSNTDEQETLAVDIFKSIVDHKQVKLDVKERDKYPNIDGYIEIVDEKRRPIGKLEVQIRKLPENYGAIPKLQCPTSLFAYSKITNNPVLLVGIDVSQRKAYWFPARDMILDQGKSSTQQTTTISFSPSRVIDGKDARYVVEWLRIAQSCQEKLREYDKLRAAYSELSKIANPALGIAKSDFREIHMFLDEINSLLDGPFYIVKRRYYPDAWKVGLAYCDYAPNSVGYTLYPLLLDENDMQIKELDKELREEFTSVHGMSYYVKENPIKMAPRQHAIKVISERMAEIIKYRLLDHRGSETLAREFIFAFVDRFAEQMGLAQSDNYTLADIRKGFYYHLPIWVYEAVGFLVREQRNRIKNSIDCMYRKPYFNPDMLRAQIMPEESKHLEQLVSIRMERGDPIPMIPVGNEQLPFGLFVEYFSYLVSSGLVEIYRLYEPPDYSRVSGGGYRWELYSPDDVERNLKTFFEGLPVAYSVIIKQNFPQLKDDLLPFDGATKVIAAFDVKDRYKSVEDGPTIALRYLKCEGESGLEIDLCKKSECKESLDRLDILFGKMVELNGKTYEPIGGSSMVLDFIYDDLPMLHFVYRELKHALDRYFDQLKER